MKKKGLLIIPLILFIIPISYSDSCNSACIKKGYSSGLCSLTCESNLTVPGAADCPKFGQVVLVIGTNAINKYQDGEFYTASNVKDQEWAWVIKNLKTKGSTYIRDTTDDTKHTGPIIGIKNNFLADTLTSTPDPAVKAGGKFCLPNDYACINFISLTRNNYATYEISKTTVDLSLFNSSWSSVPAILINSIDVTDGLRLQTSGWDIPLASSITTNKIWVIHNSSSYAGIYYQDSSNAKQVAGYINMNSTTIDKNLANINYGNTKDNNVQFHLRNNFGIANSLNMLIDILGKKGKASVEGADDLTISLMHYANGDFEGFGTTASSAEDIDLIWNSTNIGKKSTDLRSLYGIIIQNPQQNDDQDKVHLLMPDNQVYANVSLVGKSSLSPTSITNTNTKVLGDIIPQPVLASELIDKENHNIIFVGGPCANPLIEEYKEFPKCSNWNLNQGEALIELTKNGKNTVMLVAGTTAEDTRMATQFVKDKFTKLKIFGKIIKLKSGNITQMSGDTSDIDFSDYPYPFIENGKLANTLFVFGDKAKSDDTIGASDIASALMKITRNTITTANNSEDHTASDTITESIPLGNNIGDTPFFNSLITSGDLATLRQEKIKLAGEDIPTEDTIELFNNGPSIVTSLSSNDFTLGSDVVMELYQGRLRYYYVFNKETDLTKVTASQPLDVKFLNSEFYITEIDTNKISSQSATQYTLNIGDTVKVDNNLVKLVDVGNEGEIRVDINSSGNMTESILSANQLININGVYIKNINTYRPGAEKVSCCCTDILSSLK